MEWRSSISKQTERSVSCRMGMKYNLLNITSPVLTVTTCGVKSPPAVFANNSPSHIKVQIWDKLSLNNLNQILLKASFWALFKKYIYHTEYSNQMLVSLVSDYPILSDHKIQQFTTFPRFMIYYKQISVCISN